VSNYTRDLMKYQRQRTKPKDITYSLYLYCLILYFRISAKDLHRFVHTNHVSI
jgi:hypothetical protein